MFINRDQTKEEDIGIKKKQVENSSSHLFTLATWHAVADWQAMQVLAPRKSSGHRHHSEST